MVSNAQFNCDVRLGFKENSIENLNKQISLLRNNIASLDLSFVTNLSLVNENLQEQVKSLSPSSKVLNLQYMVKTGLTDAKYEFNVEQNTFIEKPFFSEFEEARKEKIMAAKEDKDIVSDKKETMRNKLNAKITDINESLTSIAEKKKSIEDRYCTINDGKKT
jgi:hypothetical protein